MARILYMHPFSAPVRAVLMTAETIGIKLQHKIVDLAKQEHFTEDFLKLNPQHTIPTLVDNGQVIWDSHAINAYLVDKYAKDDSLYPKDLFRRAIVNQRLHFDSGLAFSWLRIIARAVKYKNLTTLTEQHIEGITDVYTHLNNFLKGNKWVAGESPTIADFCLISTITSLNEIYPVQTEYGRVQDWLKRSEELPCYGLNQTGLESFKQTLKPLLLNTARDIK